MVIEINELNAGYGMGQVLELLGKVMKNVNQLRPT
jgi:hypothetical protein